MKDNPAATDRQKRKHGCLLTILIFLGVAVAVAALIEVAAPARLEALIADQLKTKLKLKKRPEVDVGMSPFLYKAATGTVDMIYVKVEYFKVEGGAEIESAEAKIRKLRFNPVKVIRTRQAMVDRIDEGRIKIVLSERTVNDLAGAQLPGTTIRLEKDRLVYTGDLPYLLEGFNYSIPGKVEVRPDNTLAFLPEIADITGLPVPQEVKDYLSDALAIGHRITEMPAGVRLTGVKVVPGKMILEAELDSLEGIIQTSEGGL